MSFALALAALFTAAGTIWQMIATAKASVDTMRPFLVHYNRLLTEQSRARLSDVAWWRRSERRRRLKRIRNEMPQVLTESELRLSTAYDHAAIGWALLSAGALTAAYVAISDLIASVG